jgi:hypothetical protein
LGRGSKIRLQKFPKIFSKKLKGIFEVAQSALVGSQQVLGYQE